jgi:hypothetical protein
VVKRERVHPGLGQPPSVRTNLDVPFLRAGRQHLYFMPDRILIFEGPQVGGVAYSGLSVDVGQTRFIEEAAVPHDAEVVDQTWRYVNKNGGPDRRFANNTQLPIARYETLHLRSGSGLNELFQVSRSGPSADIASACALLATVTRLAATAPPSTPAAATTRQSEAPSVLPRTIPFDGPERLRSGLAAQIIRERGAAWEYRAFAAAMTNAMQHLPHVPPPPMPAQLFARPHVFQWAEEQMGVPSQLFEAIERLIEVDLPAAVGLPGKPGNPDSILRVAWNVGYQAAGARVWAAAVRATSLPERYSRLREELANTVDQPLHQVEAFGPELMRAIDEALRAPEGSPARNINLNLKFMLANADALRLAMREAFE